VAKVARPTLTNVRICHIEALTRLGERSGHGQGWGLHSRPAFLPVRIQPVSCPCDRKRSRFSNLERCPTCCRGRRVLGLGLLWWGSEDYLKASLQFAMAAAFLMFALDGLIWPETRRPIWANAILGAVLAYFLIGVGLLFAT
jgi:hypothetical protein